MPEEPLQLHDVLRAEYQTLRPAADLTSESLDQLRSRIHAQDHPLSALCISGGGIRSATLALGSIQGLAEYGLLDQFDYLSTVSGGGYIGSWLSAWAKRAGGLRQVIPHLRRDARPVAEGEPNPIEHLREYNNYLSPRLGFFSADTWTLAATVVRNILLNWLVLVPLLMFALALPRVLLSLARLGETYKELFGKYAPISESPVVVYGLPAFCAFMLALAIYHTARYLPGIGGRPHTQKDFLWGVLAPLVATALGFCAFDSLFFWGDKDIPTTVQQLFLWVLVPCGVGWGAFLLLRGRTMKERGHVLILPLSFGVLIMAACTGFMAWLITNQILPATSWAWYVTLAPPLLLISFDLGCTMFVGLASRALEDEDREWMARASAWTQLFCLCWSGACALVLLAPAWAFDLLPVWGKSLVGAAGGVSGWLCGRGKLSDDEAGSKSTAGLPEVVKKYAMKAAPAVFLITFSIGLSALTNWIFYKTGALFWSKEDTGWKPVDFFEHDKLLEHTYWWAAVGAALAFFGVAWLMARFININRFSLHDMYRNRLIRAYLGASSPGRMANGFTGFTGRDNLCMQDLRTVLKPLHVVNITLNLVSGERLAWQQRRAQSFTVSPLHCGNYELGYRDAARYGGSNGISLGTAVTISGAAASPNMGYHSSPIVGMIMTLFNARLGAWLGNPGPAGERTWRQDGPRSAIASMVREAFGLTTNDGSYVYLSDGGHFENLALYEMVLRRCRHIVVLDAGCDGDYTYEDLGNALRKIRIDLRIPIDFPDELIQHLRGKTKRCAVARIRYSAVDGPCPDGVLIYLKPMLLGTEPPDVQSYSRSSATFPHESTGDQWFDESQTESYRMLGLHSMDEMCRGWEGGDLAGFAEHVAKRYLGGEPAAKAAVG